MNEINLQKIKNDAQEYYRRGDFFCSEAVIASIKNNIAPDMPDAIVRCGSGFPVGAGRSKCMCGAISGAIICLGYFFGRSTPSDQKSAKCMDLAQELQRSFRENHKGVLCCYIHTKGMDMASGQHKEQCVTFTGEMAEKTAQIIARELNLNIVD